MKSVLDMYDNDALNEIDEQLRGIPVSVDFEQVETVEYDLNGRALYFTLHISPTEVKSRRVQCYGMTLTTVFIRCVRKQIIRQYLKNSAGRRVHTRRLYDRFLYLETFCRIGFGNLKTADDVLKLPRRYRNLTADLRAFIDTVNSDTPAVRKNTVRVEIDGKSKK